MEALTAYSTLALAILTFFLAVGTGILARYTFKLWRETQRMASEAREASERQARETAAALQISKQSADAMTESAEHASASNEAEQAGRRAWLTWSEVTAERFVRSVNTEIGQGVEVGTVFTIHWTNTGETAATFVTLFTSTAVMESSDTGHPMFRTPSDLPTFAVMPRATFTGSPQHVAQPIVERLKARTVRLFIYSSATYHTVFIGLTKFTTVCLEISYKGRDPENHTDLWSFSPVSGSGL